MIPSTLLSYFLLISFCFLLFFLLNVHFISFLCVRTCARFHCSVFLLITASMPYTDNPPLWFLSACIVTVPTATILGGPDLHVDKGSTINLTCTIKYSPEPPAYIFWYHHDEVRMVWQLLLGVGWNRVPWHCCLIQVCFSRPRWHTKVLEWQVVKENCNTQKHSALGQFLHLRSHRHLENEPGSMS